MKIFPNFFIAKYLYSFSFLFTLFLILLRTNNSFINPKKSSNPTISKPSYISILYHNLPFTIHPYIFLQVQHQKKKKKKKKSQSSSNCTLPPPQFWKRAENCKFFSSTVERQRTRSNSASLDKPFFFFFFFFFGRVETLPGRACIFNSRLSAPLHPLFHRRKKEKKRDVSTRERVRASVVVG